MWHLQSEGGGGTQGRLPWLPYLPALPTSPAYQSSPASHAQRLKPPTGPVRQQCQALHHHTTQKKNLHVTCKSSVNKTPQVYCCHTYKYGDGGGTLSSWAEGPVGRVGWTFKACPPPNPPHAVGDVSHILSIGSFHVRSPGEGKKKGLDPQNSLSLRRCEEASTPAQ